MESTPNKLRKSPKTTRLQLQVNVNNDKSGSNGSRGSNEKEPSPAPPPHHKKSSSNKERDDVLGYNVFEEKYTYESNIANNVFVYRRNDNGVEVLVKRVSLTPIAGEAKYNELIITRALKSKYVPKLLSVYTDKRYDYLVYKYTAGVMDLEDYVKKGRMRQDELDWISRQLIYIVRHIHKCGVVHLDIKLKNFIIGGKKVDGEPQIQIIDFGISHMLKDTLNRWPTGTILYADPELKFLQGDFKNKEWDKLKAERLKAIDYWAVGICILLLHFPDLIREFGENKNHLAVANFVKMVIGGGFKRAEINRFIEDKLGDLLNANWEKRNLSRALRKFTPSGRSTSSQRKSNSG